jgi:hypothetical protein
LSDQSDALKGHGFEESSDQVNALKEHGFSRAASVTE